MESDRENGNKEHVREKERGVAGMRKTCYGCASKY